MLGIAALPLGVSSVHFQGSSCHFTLRVLRFVPRLRGSSLLDYEPLLGADENYCCCYCSVDIEVNSCCALPVVFSCFC
jgi:hypothetical protein